MKTDSQQSENLLREILFIVFSQKRLIIDTAIAIFIVVLAVAFLSPKVYLGQASLLVKGKRVERDPEIIEQIRDRRLPITHEDLNSELQILASSQVLKQSVIQLHEQHGLFDIDIDAARNVNGDVLQYPPLSQSVKKVEESLQVLLVPSSKVLKLSFEWRSASEAKQILAVLIEQYFKYRNTVFKPQKIRDFYDETVNNYQQLIDQQHQKLFDIIEKIKAPSVHKEIESNLNLVKEYGERLGQVEQQRLAKEAQVNLLMAQLNEASQGQFDSQKVRLFSNLNRLSIRELATKVHQNLAAHREISMNYTTTSAKAKAATDSLKKSYQLLLDEVDSISQQKQSELKALEQSITFLAQQTTRLDNRNTELAKLQVELERITRDKDLLEQSFANYYKLREETFMLERTHNASLNTQVVLLTPVWADQTAVFPNKRLLIPFGFIIAILVGLTAGFIKEYFDDTIKRLDDSDKFIGVPTIISFSDRDPVPPRSLFQTLWDNVAKRLGRLSRKAAKHKNTTMLIALILIVASVLLSYNVSALGLV